MEPPAVFRVTASGSRFWPAPVGDLDPDNVVRHLDRDRLAGGNRAAVPQTLGEKLAHQQGGHVRAQMTGAKHPLYNARASLARSARPASVTVSRTARPAISAPAFPAARIPGNRAGRRADTPGWTPDSGANVKARAPPERAPEPPSSGYPHRSLAPIPVRHASVDTAI